MLDALVASEGEPDLVQISGGEPTIHPQILEIIAAARRRPIRHVMINTNGIRIARGPGLRRALAALGPGFEVYLQFDSLDDEALMNLRGAALVAHPPPGAGERSRRAASRRRWSARCKRGVNDDEIGDIVDMRSTASACAASSSSRSRMPAATRASIRSCNRIVLSEIRRRIVEGSGVFADGDMIPLPCNPASISIGYGVRDGAKVIPLTSLMPREELLPAMPNAITFEKYPELRRRFVDLLSLSTAEANTDGAAGLAALLPARRADARGLGYENVFRVTIVEFLDRFNFGLGTSSAPASIS